ncbi:uncharacterized protein KY384_001971 [Bacidia gigantensis]|uniref:uncharacterized protein n=1 Tax=Bacidia gigantensis TaxID=2732470 RepID=UPI001D04EEDC|nr:uncharacterized protein KY384_001971 [Bacidia gigantensis]KAG8533188.1 hypothetical protein KY384_001971 [Bacidia gigantensis]
MAAIRLLLVVDGYFSLGPQDRNDRSFSVSHLIKTLKSSTAPKVSLDTAHRDGDLDATIWGKFDFAESVTDLSIYQEIWMFGYNGANQMDPKNATIRPPLREPELRAISQFMQNGGGILASGDHEGLGSFMCGRIPRVRSMRKWFSAKDTSPDIPAEAPRNWPVSGPDRADTLQKGVDDEYLFTNQSDDIPQPLKLIEVPRTGIHEVFKLDSQTVLQHFPDHFHEGEVLGFGGVDEKSSKPWTLEGKLTFDGKTFVEYPSNGSGHQEVPQIIATGTVTGGHKTAVEKGKLCESGFEEDDSLTNAKTINTLSVYNGHEVDVGRVLTDSSFHHFCDLNLIGDPCAVAKRTQGFDLGFLAEMDHFLLNVVKWLARK